MNRKDYKRVTEIVDLIFPFNEEQFKSWAYSQGLNPEWITSESIRIGNKIHEWIQNRVEQIEWADLPPISEKEEGYLEAVERILDDFEILESEVKVYNDQWQYRGTLDAIAKLRNTDEMCILDFKSWNCWNDSYKRSSEKIKKVSTQLSMYRDAYGKDLDLKVIVITSGGYVEENIEYNDLWKTWIKDNLDIFKNEKRIMEKS